jgi:hypothetical protein
MDKILMLVNNKIMLNVIYLNFIEKVHKVFVGRFRSRIDDDHCLV